MDEINTEDRTKPFFVACYLLLLKQHQVLLLRRQNTGYEDGSYSLIAGHVESHETILDAMVREAYEETGIEVDPEQLTFHRVVHRKGVENRIYLDFFFTCRHWRGQPSNREPSKCDEIRWAAQGDLPSNVIPHVRQAIDGLTEDVSPYCESGW